MKKIEKVMYIITLFCIVAMIVTSVYAFCVGLLTPMFLCGIVYCSTIFGWVVESDIEK
jgi:hypothetical protein